MHSLVDTHVLYVYIAPPLCSDFICTLTLVPITMAMILQDPHRLYGAINLHTQALAACLNLLTRPLDGARVSVEEPTL